MGKTDDPLDLKYPAIFPKVEAITKEVVGLGGIPIDRVGSGKKLLRSVDEKFTPFDARRVWNHSGKVRWNGRKPVMGTTAWERGEGCLYLSEGIISLTKEGIFYGFKDFAEKTAKGASLNHIVYDLPEENIISDAFYGKIVYVYELTSTKNLADLDPKNSFISAICSRLDSDKDIRDVLAREGHKNAAEMLFQGDDYSLARPLGGSVLAVPNVDGLIVDSARIYTEGDDRNLAIKPDGPNDCVNSLRAVEKIQFIPNAAHPGVDQIVVTDLSKVPKSSTTPRTGAGSKDESGKPHTQYHS